MSKLVQSAGDTAQASCSAALQAVPAPSTARHLAPSGRVSRCFDQITQLAMASIEVLELAAAHGDRSGYLSVAGIALARQLGQLADAGLAANGETPWHDDAVGWLLPTTVEEEQQ